MSLKSLVVFLRYQIGSLILIFCLTGFTLAGRENIIPASTLDQGVELSMKALYDFDFFEADRITAGLVAHFPGHYLSHFTRAQYLWWMIITHPSDVLLEKAYHESLGQALSIIKPLLVEEPVHHHTFYFINIYAMKARLLLNKREYLRTIFSLKQCVDQIEAALGKELVYPPFFLSSGMYNYMSEQAREKLPFLTLYTLLYPKGDKMLGLSQLHTAAQSDYFIWRTEATYLLMRIYHEMEKQPYNAQVMACNLRENYPGNLIFRMEYVKILETLGDREMLRTEKEQLVRATRTARGISERQRAYLLDVLNK